MNELRRDKRIIKIVAEMEDGLINRQEAAKRIMQLFERDGVEARSSALLASSGAENKGHGNERTEAKRGSDVGPLRCPATNRVCTSLACIATDVCYARALEGTGQRREERAERRANPPIEPR